MKITEFKESGCNNILMWAINNNADIQSDIPLRNLIDNELFYLVTFSDVNMMDLFRLSQTYRNKLRVINEYKADVPPMSSLIESFPGQISDPDDANSKVALAELAEYAITNFVNIALQMHSDSDIITPSAVRLYLPMISRRFDVQIPISFMDVIDSFNSDDSAKFFGPDYVVNLEGVVSDPDNKINIMLNLLFVKVTSIIKYNPRFDKYLNRVKYAALSKCANNKLYKVCLLGFHKFDEVSKGEIRCSMFNADKDQIIKNLRLMSISTSPLEVDVAVQLPIQLMQILCNYFGPDMLTISCESSMSSIINEGLMFNDFVAPEDTDSNIDSVEASVKSNAISAYRVRLMEANQIALNAIQTALQSGNDIDVSSVMAILPSIYLTKAVLTINVKNLRTMIDSLPDRVLNDMLTDIHNISDKILNDISNAATQ